MADYCPKLIEVALPIQEISFESARDKSLRHGHISTLHLWWARRPLAASRAIVFASLVPDPDDPKCPKEFQEKVKELLSSSLYKPYDDIPGTAERDPMPDTPRNRLLMFIAKFSNEYIKSQIKGAKPPRPDEGLIDSSLVKWESGINKATLSIARELIKTANNGDVPKVLDSFAGGGAIPLEAARLGCESYANELNPVAYLVERAGLEFPQKFGKSLKMSKDEYKKKYGIDSIAVGLSTPAFDDVTIPNILSHDIKYWANWVSSKVYSVIGRYYDNPVNKNMIVAYYWVRTIRCSNPSCHGIVPLLRSTWICNTSNKKVALRPHIDKEKKVTTFDIALDEQIDFNPDEGFNKRGNATCPYCTAVTPDDEVRSQAREGKMNEQLVAVIENTDSGKVYRMAEESDLNIFNQVNTKNIDIPTELILPEITGKNNSGLSNSTGIRVHLYGMTTWGSLFNRRQINTIDTFVKIIREAKKEIYQTNKNKDYSDAIILYLGLWLDRIALIFTNVGRWNNRREESEHPYSRQAIAITWDYPENNPFSDVTGSASNQLSWIIRYIEREYNQKQTNCILGSATELIDFKDNTINAVITDPPYYDAISYADLSDFFYVWLKRTLGDTFPSVFSTPLTPKGKEVTSLKHRHKSPDEAKKHFETLLCDSFKEARRVIKDDGIISIMFAHQSTEAWTAFIKAILGAGLTITASWPIDTEMKNKIGAVSNTPSSYLASSVTVICRKRESGTTVSFDVIRKELEKEIESSINRNWQYGIRRADLIVSAFGPAVGVFGKYEHVEKADGTEVSVTDLLKIVREFAFKKIVGELSADEMTTVYVGWLNLYGTETQKWDDARQTIQIGTEINLQEAADRRKVFVREGDSVRIALLADRKMPKLGESVGDPLIDMVHKSMLYWQQEDRTGLITYLSEQKLYYNELYWKLLQALFEILPNGSGDWKLVQAILSDKASLISSAKQFVKKEKPEQMQMV